MRHFYLHECLILWLCQLNLALSNFTGCCRKRVLLSRGVKQGCPLSTYLFIMAIKMLAIKIRTNNKIKGIEIRGLKTKVSLYAEDLCFLLKPPFGSLQRLIDNLDHFSNLSGIQLNYDKCTLIKLDGFQRLVRGVEGSWRVGLKLKI